MRRAIQKPGYNRGHPVGGTPVSRAKCQSGGTHGTARSGIFQQSGNFSENSRDIPGTPCRAGLRGLLRRHRKVVDRRSDKHRDPRSTGFNEILTAVVQQTATDERDIRCAVISGKFANAVTRELAAFAGYGTIGATAYISQAALFEQGGDIGKTLRMAWNYDHQGVPQGLRLERIQDQRFFPVPSAGGQENLPRTEARAQFPRQLLASGGGLDVKFQVPGHCDR